MKAIVFHEHGRLENVHYTDVPKPAIGPDETLIEVKAAALNRLDLWVLEGWPSLKLKMPHIMGSDGAGIVAEIGSHVSNVAVGDRVAINPTLANDPFDPFTRAGKDNLNNQMAVLGEHVAGFFAEYTAVPARNLLKMPDSATFENAAAASLVYVTAWHSLIVRGSIRAGESVLIIGAGGGVNTASIQIAQYAGASPIIVVGSDAKKCAKAKELGADMVIDRSQEDWGRAVYKMTNKNGVDIVVDNVGAATYPKSLRALKKGGRLLTVGNTSGPMLEIDNRLLFGKHLSIIGSSMGSTVDYETVMNLLFDGTFNPVIDSVYPLHEGLLALHRLEAGDVSGKLILKP